VMKFEKCRKLQPYDILHSLPAERVLCKRQDFLPETRSGSDGLLAEKRTLSTRRSPQGISTSWDRLPDMERGNHQQTSLCICLRLV